VPLDQIAATITALVTGRPALVAARQQRRAEPGRP